MCIDKALKVFYHAHDKIEVVRKDSMKLNLKYWRTRRAMTIRDLVAASKVSSQTIVRIEKYGEMPTPAVIKKLSAALNVPVDELIQDTEKDTTETSKGDTAAPEPSEPEQLAKVA